MMDRAVPFAKVIDGVVPHFVSRTIFTGSGKVGVETPALDADRVHFQISQRAEFFEEIVGLETTLKRPIVNTRDEPHADPTRFRRLHVIVGDANLSEIATLLKVGTTAIVLAMIEDDAGPTRPGPGRPRPRPAPRFGRPLPDPRPHPDRRHHRHRPGMQWELFGAARKYAEHDGLTALGDDGQVGELILEHWEYVLEGLESDPATLADTLDWVAKRELLLAYQDRHNCDWRRPPGGRPGPAVPRPAGRQVRLPAPGPAAAHHAGRGQPGRERAPAGYPGLVPGQVPGPLARGRGDRQLGLPRLRHRDRPPPTRPYDGSPEGNSRTHGRTPGPEHRTGGPAGPAQLLKTNRDDEDIRTWQNKNRIQKSPAGTLQDRDRRRLAAEQAPATSERGEKIKAELDDLLDEIDEVLEDNAEEFVRNYVQKGGQ